jgi:O-antigen/teichoic acid export membrane protein
VPSARRTRYLLFGSVVSQAILGVVGPKLSELLTGGMRARAKAVYRAATAWGMILSWPFYLTMAVFAPALLSVLGHNFLQARTVLIVLGLSMVVATGVGPVDMVLLMGGKSTWNLLNTLAAVILNITLNLLLIPRLGMEGAAIAWSASILANNLVPLIQTWSFLKLHPFGRPPFVVGAAAVACFGGGGLAAALAFGTALPVLLVSFALSSIVYASILWRFRADIESAVLWEALRSLRPSLRREPST